VRFSPLSLSEDGQQVVDWVERIHEVSNIPCSREAQCPEGEGGKQGMVYGRG